MLEASCTTGDSVWRSSTVVGTPVAGVGATGLVGPFGEGVGVPGVEGDAPFGESVLARGGVVGRVGVVGVVGVGAPGVVVGDVATGVEVVKKSEVVGLFVPPVPDGDPMGACVDEVGSAVNVGFAVWVGNGETVGIAVGL